MSTNNEQQIFNIEEEESGQRLDAWLSEKVSDLSRSRVKKLIQDEQIKVDDKAAKASQKLKVGQTVELIIPPPVEISAEAENIPVDIVYEDEDLIVVNKAKGMVTHPADGTPNGTLVNALLYHCNNLSGIGGFLRPGIVHRLDKDTSGLLVVAKNDQAHQSLSVQIQEKSAKRFYRAYVLGNIKEDTGEINQPIARNKTDRKKMAIDKDGREALTYWNVLERYKQCTYLELELKTGRTHQIRVHLAHIKHGILGDPVYGPQIKFPVKLSGQALHAYKLSFTHPRTGKEMEFTAEEPLEMKKIHTYLNQTYQQL